MEQPDADHCGEHIGDADDDVRCHSDESGCQRYRRDDDQLKWPSIDDGYDIEESLRRLVEGTVEVLARAAPLVWTVLGDETARAGYEHKEGLRRVGYGDLVAVLAQKHPMRAGLTPAGARDLLLVLTGPQVFVQYTRDLGWSHSDYAEWTITAALEQLFGIVR